MLTPIPYQSLNWTNRRERENCFCSEPVYIDASSQLLQLVQTDPFNGYNLLNYTYTGDIYAPVPTTRTPTLVRLTESPTGTFCYSRSSGQPYWGSYQVSFTERVSETGDMGNGDYIRVRFNYTSNVMFTVRLQLLKDDSGLEILDVIKEINANFDTGEYEAYFQVPISYANGYAIKLTFFSSSVDDAEFCFSDLEIMQMTVINEEESAFVDCNGALTSLTFTQEFFGDQILLTITPPSSGQGYIYLVASISPTDEEIDDHFRVYSSNFTLFTPGTCRYNPLIQVLWRSACHLENDATSYSSLEYEFYVRGYTERVPLVTDERITHTLPSGRKTTVYNYDYLPYQVKVGLYDIWVHETLERAYVSSYFSVNGNEYQVDNASSYAIAPIGNGGFTGRVEMIKVGTERILSDCCCPISNITLGCGSLTITDVCIVATVRLIKYEIDEPGTGSSVDVMFENLSAIDDSPCSIPVNTQHIESSVSSIGAAGNAASFTAADFQQVFDDNFCGATDIQYYIRIRMRCNDAIVGDWSDPITIVPDNLEVCS